MNIIIMALIAIACLIMGFASEGDLEKAVCFIIAHAYIVGLSILAEINCKK